MEEPNANGFLITSSIGALILAGQSYLYAASTGADQQIAPINKIWPLIWLTP
jgi:uncharacterized membrane protein